MLPTMRRCRYASTGHAVIRWRRAQPRRLQPGPREGSMPHARASMVIQAPPERVMQLYRDYTHRARLFPATIRGVRLIRSDGVRTEVEVDHRAGLVPDVMTEVAPNRIDLWEAKRRYVREPIRSGSRRDALYDIRRRPPQRRCQAARTGRGSDHPASDARVRAGADAADGGESGIRTHGRVSPTHAFQACAIDHSAISPL